MLGNRIVLAIIVLVGVPLATIAYVALVERFVGIFPPKVRDKLRPALWIGPGIALLAIFLIYPTVNTFVLSFMNANSSVWVGLKNYIWVFTNSQTLDTLFNNLLWLVFLTGLTVTIGLLLAVLFDRVRYEAVAKALIFLPMAVSFVAASVIWKFMMYTYNPPHTPQIGTFNAVWTLFGGHPVAWLIHSPFINNLALIIVGVWVWTGFALVILSAALKSIPKETIEAAKVDGANEFQVFRFVTLPMMSSTIAVVATTMVIFALKAFDIVYVMTSGNFNTDVMANRMYKEMFQNLNFGRASAIAMILLLAIIPIMLINIRRFREQEAIR